MAKHTKGPWAPAIYTVSNDMIERLKSGPQAAICLNHSPNQKDEMLVAICGDASDPQSIADSHLIAAAPDMLAALDAAYNDIIHLINYGNFKGANFTTPSISCVDGQVELNAGYIVDVIAKATGEI